jgi:hypothetical protein
MRETTRLRVKVTSSRAANVFCGPELPNGTILVWRGHEEEDLQGNRWLFVGQEGGVDGWIKAEHTMCVMIGHRSGTAQYTDLRPIPNESNTNYQGRIQNETVVKVNDHRLTNGVQWVDVSIPNTGIHGWIKIQHLRDFNHHAVGGGGGGARHHAVGGGVCPLTEQLHQAAIRAAQHQSISQHDMALAQQQMQGFRRQQAQAEAMARAQAQARGMQVLGALGLPFGLHFM